MKRRSFPSSKWLKWLTPGIHVKRWLGALMFGAILIGLSVAAFLLEIDRVGSPRLVQLLTLSGLPFWLRASLALALGSGLIVLSLYRLGRSILTPLEVRPPQLIDAMVEHRQRARGPKLVAIGGGTGMPTLLRGMKAHNFNLTAVVTVADDGGSSGRLRRDLGVLPPGDFRNNIAALARDEDLMTQLFQYRFGEGGLEGHSFGNLFITAMSGVTGSFDQALAESSRVLAIRGRVLPSTLKTVMLSADMRERTTNQVRRVVGESSIPRMAGQIERVFLQPEDVPPYPAAVKAILGADLVVIGPGSLFTSILPNLLVCGIADALRVTQALKIYVCNVATQKGETEEFTVLDHIRAIEKHAGTGLFDVVLANSSFPSLAPDANFKYVRLPETNGSDPGVTIRSMPLVNAQQAWRHDSQLLAQSVIRLFEEYREGVVLENALV